MSQHTKQSFDLLASSNVTDILEQGAPAGSGIPPDEGIFAIALEIANQRRDTLLQLKAALERGDLPKAKILAKELSGDETSD